MKKYDVVVVGTGTAGQTAALDLVAEGYDVAIVENSDTPGGVCALRGCQAKKWFYEAAETAARCRHLYNRGVNELPAMDWGRVVELKNTFTAQVPENTVKNLKGSGVSYFRGNAELKDEFTVQVGAEHIQGRFIVIATGASPIPIKIEGGEHTITSNQFLELEEVPKRVAFIGGGFISFEFAHFVAQLGGIEGEVHILEAQNRVLHPFDSEMVEQLVMASQKEGVVVHTDVSVDSISRSTHGFLIHFQDAEVLEVDLVVNGIGRTPNLDVLNPAAAGVVYDKKGILVDKHMQTSSPNIYAAGDCAATVQLARVADMEAKTAARAIIAEINGDSGKAMSYDSVPSVLYTYPQLGMVGKTEDSLIEEGVRYWKSSEFDVSWPTYKRLGLRHCGFKILVDADDRILGAHFLSDNTTGLVSTFAFAMRSGLTIGELHENSILTPYPSRESDIIYMLEPLVE